MGKTFKGILGVALLAACLIGLTALPLAAQYSIPQGSTITNAVFSIYEMNGPTYQVVNLYRITADWGENSATWNNFAGHYDPSGVGFFVTDSLGWHSVDLTALVQLWVNGTYPNFGFVMIQGPTPYTLFYSSEASYPALVPMRPKLEIWYTPPVGNPGYIVIQRPEAAQDGVADTYVWQLTPDAPASTENLYTGNVGGFEKFSLIRFNFIITPPPPGTGTPGYWMNHPEAWPEDGIVIGGDFYSRSTAIELMKMAGAGDKTYTMYAALVAAKLNVMIGNPASCVSATIAAADAWLIQYPMESGVAAGGKNSAWRTGEQLYLILDSYNNGLLCAPHRD